CPRCFYINRKCSSANDASLLTFFFVFIIFSSCVSDFSFVLFFFFFPFCNLPPLSPGQRCTFRFFFVYTGIFRVILGSYCCYCCTFQLFYFLFWLI
ncbi:hypothetical protein T310_9214, partial [Rasamsonia emersonii CBS 393.64]